MKRKPLKLPPNTVGVTGAKRDLTALIERVVRTGKPVTIAKRGKPIVQLIPVTKKLGFRWRREFTIPDDDPFWQGLKEAEIWRKTAPARGTPQVEGP